MTNTKSNTRALKVPKRESYHADELRLPEIVHLGRYDQTQATLRPLKNHSHTGAFEICYLAKGQQSYWVGDKEYRLRGGDVFLTFPDEEHSSGSRPQEKGTLTWLVFTLPTRDKPWFGLSPQESKKIMGGLLALKQRHFRGTSDMRVWLEDAFEAVAAAPTDFSRLTLSNRLVGFIMMVIEEGNRHTESSSYQPFKTVIDHIDKNIFEKMTVPELAEIASLSVSRFKAVFKKLMGVAPADFVLRRKIEKASYLLEQGNSTVTETAFSLGFSSSQYFATVFKRYTGRSPGSFQKKSANP